MTEIPVVWVSYRQPAIASGFGGEYHDQGLLRRVMDRDAWSPPNALTYRHVDGFENLGEADGAVVVVPAQHHAAPAEIERLRGDLARLAWCVVILTGDECSLYPWSELDHPRMALWVMTPRPRLHKDCDAFFFGEGYRSSTTAVLDEFAGTTGVITADLRSWFFAGQVTHARRQALAKQLRRRTDGMLVETPGFLQGLAHADYLAGLTLAKLAPAPSGPCTPDSFRLYEALEAGCVPIADGLTPEGWLGYWEFVYGDVPFPVVDDWATLPSVIDAELVAWPANANRCGAWWTARKREMALRLDDDVRRVSRTERSESTLADLLTVIVTTSPIAEHPSMWTIDATLDSIAERLSGCEVIVAADGVRPEQEERRGDYDEYLRRLLWSLSRRRRNHLPLLVEEFVHQANLTRLALDEVRTPLILFVEHDTPLVGDIPFAALCQPLLRGAADVVRLHHESHVLAPHRYLMWDHVEDVVGVPLTKTAQWSQRPHLASANWYRWMLDTFFKPECRTMIEDRYYGEVATPWVEKRKWGEDCKLWLYTPPGDMKRSEHLDGRAGGEKYEMTW